ILTRFVHQMPGRCPIAMTVQQGSDNSAIQHPRKGLVAFCRHPITDDLLAPWETADPQAFGISRTATPTSVVWCVFLLKRFRRVCHTRRTFYAPSPDTRFTYARSAGPT